MTTPDRSDRSPAHMTPDERRALLAQLLQDKARANRTTAPLSHGQAALWFTHAMAPDSSAYNVAFSAKVHSTVDVVAMGRAFQALVDRHAILRTTFQAPEGKLQQVIAGAADLDFVEVDAAGWSDSELHDRVSAAYRLPFDLEHGPLLRVFLFTRGPAEHVLLVALHHIVFDGSSMGVLLDEFQVLYRAACNGSVAQLPPLQHTYTDFVTWQHAMLAGPEGQKSREYWHRKLAGVLPLIDLPLDRPRPAVQTFHGASHEISLSRALVQQLRALAKAEHTTLYSVLLAAFYVLLHRYSGQEDLIVGTPMLGRSRAEFQRSIGYFVSPVALRADLWGEPTFRAVLSQVRQTVLEGLEHQDYPFTRLVEELQPRRTPGRSTIIEVLFNLQQTQRLGSMADRMVAQGRPAETTPGQLELEPFHLSQEEGQFDLTLLMFEAGEDLFGGLKYNPDLFDAATMARMGAHFLQLLDSIVAEPAAQISRLPMMRADEREHVLVDLNATNRPYDLTMCLHPLIEAQVARQPDAIALRFEGEAMTYAELNARANQLAEHLRGLGVGPDVLVGVCAERSFELVIALMATLKAGGAYVPLDPSYPAERLQFMLKDAAPKVVLTQSDVAERLSFEADGQGQPDAAPTVIVLDQVASSPAGMPSADSTNEVTANNLAYMIYTSGSTGRPKGALNEHRSIVNRLLWMQEQYGLTADDRVMQKTPFSFDVSVWEFFWPLLTGATLVLARPDGHKDPAYLVDLIQTEGITTMHFVPSMLQLFLEDEEIAGCTSLRRVICSGEALPHELVERFFAKLPHVELHNLYGPTEAAVDVSYWPCQTGDPRGIVPIGRPVANTQLYVLDRHLQPVPQGVAGELHIGGTQVGRGYHNRPELTAEKFIADPFADLTNALALANGPITLPTSAPACLYKTGDLARVLVDGSLEYLGRIDFQVKIRGFRIELGEIEAVLGRHPAVREAVVTAHTDPRGDKRLVAYLTVRESVARPGAGALRSALRQTLPDYMIPTAFVFLEHLPLSANGKVDRRALPAPDPVRTRGDSAYTAPSTATEEAIAAVWRTVLGLDRVSVYDNFFDLGGHSLIAVEALARLNQQLGVKLGPADIRLQTLGQLAATYDSLLAQAAAQPMSQLTPGSTEDRPSRAEGLFGAVRRVIVRKPAKTGNAAS